MAQRITRLTTDQKIPGSNPGKLVPLLLLSLIGDWPSAITDSVKRGFNTVHSASISLK